MTSDVGVAKDRLVTDFKAVIADTEELLKATASQSGEQVSAARTRVQETIENTRERLAELQESAVDKARTAARATDQMVHDNPWKAVGIAAGVGFLLGLLVHRRD
jgi:ElaB/YqjD/DUF883 family membrane-anchored ribosome-binding protein